MVYWQCCYDICWALSKIFLLEVANKLFSIDNDTLTLMFKLKRHQTGKMYQTQIDAMYEIITRDEAARDVQNNQQWEIQN